MRNKLIVWTCLQKKKKEEKWRRGNVSMKSRYNNNNKRIRENEKDKYKHLNK